MHVYDQNDEKTHGAGAVISREKISEGFFLKIGSFFIDSAVCCKMETFDSDNRRIVNVASPRHLET